ncbi:MAG: folate-binding protein [Deinococcus-Thermus bacterium]|jgi:folate-binding protein YgfZ|nr:folate-binding protein [Deinococcota bacterium]
MGDDGENAMARWTRLDDRAVLEVGGADGMKLLQGLVSNDLDRLGHEPAVYAALLTPQGKYLFDFLVCPHGDVLWLDVEAARLDDLVRRLTLYRLRADVTFIRRDDLGVYAVFDGDAPAVEGAAIDVVDPRLAALGRRVIGTSAAVEPGLDAVATAAAPGDFDQHRLTLGVPDGSRDLEPDKALLLENGFVELHGVDFEKGCFVGQELTARMRYRGTVRKRLVPVTLEGTAEPGTAVRAGDIDVGELRSVNGAQGLALIRLDRWEKAQEAGEPLQAETAVVSPRVPDWLDLTFASKRAESSA